MGEVSARGWVCLGEDRDEKFHVTKGKVRSVLQAKLLALEIKALPKDANVDALIADFPKVERNRNPTTCLILCLFLEQYIASINNSLLAYSYLRKCE